MSNLIISYTYNTFIFYLSQLIIKKPLLRQQERFPHNPYEVVYNVYIRRDTYNTHKNIVSSSEQLCKRNTRSLAGCYFYTHFYIK